MSKNDIKIILAFRFFYSLSISLIDRNKHNNNNTNLKGCKFSLLARHTHTLYLE